MPMRAAVIFVLAVALSHAAFAHPAAVPPAPSDAALAARLAHDSEIADQDRRSDALNVEVNRKNAAVEARNRAVREADAKAQADYRVALAAREAEIARIKADADKVQADFAKATADWQVRVAACKAGDVKSCEPPPAALAARSASPLKN
jgi:hypothetical protein